MAVKIMIQFDGKVLTIPINPEEMEIEREADNEDIDIIGLGQTMRKGAPGLVTTTIESFFPAPNSFFYTGVKPKTCVDFIEKIQKTANANNKVAKIVTSGLPKNLNMYFLIQTFNYDHKAGEEQDIYYTLEIKQYVPYGVQIIKKAKTGTKTARVKSTAKKAKSKKKKQDKPKEKKYKVKRGDCLWKITKKYTGKGSRWKELYKLNKKVIGKNPNLIYPGQVLTLPAGW